MLGHGGTDGEGNGVGMLSLVVREHHHKMFCDTLLSPRPGQANLTHSLEN